MTTTHSARSALKAIAFNCSLKHNGEPSSTRALLEDIGRALATHGVVLDIVDAASQNILPGTRADEGPGDAWPALRTRVLTADIVIMGSPIWVGQQSSISRRVLERLDAFLTEGDASGRMPSYGKVGAAAIVGNEDGAHHVGAEIYQALNDLGFSLAANAMTYWVGEARTAGEYRKLDPVPASTTEATALMVRNAVHLAALLKREGYQAAEAMVFTCRGATGRRCSSMQGVPNDSQTRVRGLSALFT